jgi:hypothetical protein
VRWVLCLLASGSEAYAEFPSARPEDARGSPDELSFPGTAAFLDLARAARGSARVVSWSLERRIGDVAVARTSGRRELP